MIKDILLSEINKRKLNVEKELKKREKELQEYNSKNELYKTLDIEIKKLENRLENLIKKEQEAYRYDYIIKLLDGTYEVVKKDDISIVDDYDILSKALDIQQDVEETKLMSLGINDDILISGKKGKVIKIID